LSLSDYHLFPALKQNLGGNMFKDYYYLLNGPVADATDAPQPWKAYCATL
jgi:hypothetical protein